MSILFSVKAFIKAISYYLPAGVLSNQDIAAQFPEWGAEKIGKKIGIEKRHVTGAGEFASDMAVKTAEKLFEENNIDRSSVDFLIYCTQSPDYFLPTTACILQHRIGLPVTAGAYDFNLGCSGYVYGLAMAKGFISAGIAKNILLVTSETYSKFIHHNDKSNRAIFGDAAAATLVSTDGFAEIKDFILGTDGAGAEKLIVKNGGLRYPKSGEEPAEVGETPGDNLYMDGPAIFNFTMDAVPQLVKQVLDKHSLSIPDVDYYVFHQANQFMLNHLRKKIGIAEEKFICHMLDCGNTVSSTIPIVLYHMQAEGKFDAKNKTLLAGFGVGYSWGGTIIETT